LFLEGPELFFISETCLCTSDNYTPIIC
jgi:hypothetical protein